MKILLVCSAGMSTDILRGELIKYAKKEQLPLEVKAVGVHAYKEYCTGYDVILLGPQIAYRREKIAAECGNLPVVAAYKETGLSTLSSVLYGTFLLLP